MQCFPTFYAGNGSCSDNHDQTHCQFYPVVFSLAAGGEARGSTSLRWPSSSDLNTRLRRIIAGYQRVVKKQELKKAAAEKVNKQYLPKKLEKCKYMFGQIYLLCKGLNLITS